MLCKIILIDGAFEVEKTLRVPDDLLLQTTPFSLGGNLRVADLTRRQYLVMKAMEHGADMFMAKEAVSSTAIEHPEWDMDEVKSFDEWEAQS